MQREHCHRDVFGNFQSNNIWLEHFSSRKMIEEERKENFRMYREYFMVLNEDCAHL